MRQFRNLILSLLALIISVMVAAQSRKSDILFEQGVDAYRRQEYNEAIKKFSECKELDKHDIATGSNRESYSDMWISSAYYMLGDELKARSLSPYYFAKPIDRKLTVKSDSLSDLGEWYLEHGHPEIAIELFKECAEIEKEVAGKDHPWYANTLCGIGSVYSDLDENEKALDYVNRGLYIYDQYAYKYPMYPQILRMGAVLNYNSGNKERGYELAKKRLEFCKSTNGIDSLSLAEAFCDFALIDYDFNEDYSNCIRNQERGLEILRRILPEDYKRIDKEENLLERMYLNAGDLKKCTGLMSRHVDRMSKNSERDESAYIEKISVLAALYDQDHQSTKAMETQGRLVKILRDRNEKDRELALALSDLSLYTHNSGNSAKALEAVEEANTIMMALSDTISPEYMSVLNTSASVYFSLLMVVKGAECIRQSLTIGDLYGHTNHKEYYRALNIAMIMAESVGLNDLAEDFNLQLLKRHQDREGLDSIALATDLQNQGSILTSQGKYEEAIPYLYQAMTIRYRNLPYIHPDMSSSFNAVGNLMAKMGEYDPAIECMDHTVAILKELNGYRKNYSTALRNRASILLDAGRVTEAKDNICEAITVTNKIICDEFMYLSPVEQKYFWRDYKKFYESLIPRYTIFINNPELNCRAYDAMLLSKGILLNSEISLRNQLLESNDTDVIQRYDAMIKLQEELNTLYKQDEKDRKEDITKLEEKLAKSQRELVSLSKEYGEYTRNIGLTMRDVQQELKPNDVAIEFMKIEEDSVPAKYAALVLNREMSAPVLIPLCDELILCYHHSDPKLLEDGLLYEYIWEPIVAYLSKEGSVLFSPAGLLHDISIENAVMNDGTVFGDAYDVRRLSSTREIALKGEKGKNNGMTHLFGNVNYDASIVDLLSSNDSVNMVLGDKENHVSKSTSPVKADRSADRMVERLIREGDYEISPLPGTKEEIDALSLIISKNRKWEMARASERMLKLLSGSRPRVVHLATHGVYFSEEESLYEDGLSFLAFDKDVSNASNKEDEALSRSGLLLAGASLIFNCPEEIPADMDDGVITSQEISLLDFRGVELVTLSACESGRGDISGEGVFGLQRGFKKAGVESILMSLWKVDDKATAVLMKEFYKHWEKGIDRHRALQLAKNKVRSQPEWADPKYWAAFILLDALD